MSAEKAIQIVKEMLIQRGYEITEQEKHEKNKISEETNSENSDEDENEENSSTSISESEESTEKIIAENENGDKICVFTTIFTKINIKIFGTLRTQLQELNIDHGIVIYKNKTSSVDKALAISGIKPEIELFQVNELQYNITKHFLYFPHIKLPPIEAKLFKDMYGTKIPNILHTDPVVRFFDFKKGDIIKVIRKDNSVAYRIVR